jgi:NTP pyrophosphatase (non-canonical NTP hydrolase)
MPPSVQLKTISKINAKRAEQWHADMEPWSLADWGNAMGGECGEAQNVVKKLRRLETGSYNLKDEDGKREKLLEKLGDELADTFLYLDLLATAAGVDLEAAIIRKFNRVSDERGFEERL